MKEWKAIDWADCIHCGDAVEVLTDAPEPGYVTDGDEARCIGCGCPGNAVVIDEDSVTIDWHDEPNCNCAWCQAHPDPGQIETK